MTTTAPTRDATIAEFAPLPSPADRPAADVLIYDGECKFCTASVHKLARWDRRGRLAFVSLHDPEVARRWPELGHDDLMQYVYLCTTDGRKLRGAEAFKYLSTRMPALYWMAPALHLPGLMPLWQACYRAFAKRRYRFGRIESCEDGSCKIPPRR
jgi:predicted DCC family thiol-disulfide oxidoreductase YuxK